MKLLFKIALLNLWRRRSRSMLVVLMIGMSVTGLLLVQGIYAGMLNGIMDNALRTDTGHISIYHSAYRKSKLLEDHISDVPKLRAYLATLPEVVSTVARVRHDGIVATAKKSQGALIIGTNLEEEQRHSRLQKFVVSGEYTFGAHHRGALIGAELAENLKVRVGQKIIITVQDMHKEINALNLKVEGIVRTNDVRIDKAGVFLSAQKLHTLCGLPAHTATQISVMVSTRDKQEPLVTAIQAHLDDQNLTAYHWTTILAMFKEFEMIEGVFFGFSFFIVFVVATLGVFGVILVSVLERVREFGIMLAIGCSFARVRNQIIIESMLLGLIGLVLGLSIGGWLLWHFSTVGIDFSAYADALQQFGMDPVSKAYFKAQYFASAATGVIAATFFAALWPIRVLKKLNPIQAVNS